MQARPKPKPVSLTQTAAFMRMFLLVFGICIGFLIVGRFFFVSFVEYWKAANPEPPPPPTQGFGPLPKVNFPTSTGAPKSIKLEMPPAKLKASADRAFVYFIKSKRANLLALDRANEQAKVMGFLFEPSRISAEMYRWKRSQPLATVLDMNIITGTFMMTLDWQADPNFLSEKRIPSEDQAITISRSLLANANLLAKDIATGSAKVSYLKAFGTSYASAVSLSEADFLQVDLFRTKVNGSYDVYTDEPDKGTIRAIVTGKTDASSQFASIEYNYTPIEYSAAETYPIITPQQAFTILSQGGGYSAQMPLTGSDVVIREIKLAYYDAKEIQPYLQPIYVLEGDGGYVGYVAAVASTVNQ